MKNSNNKEEEIWVIARSWIGTYSNNAISEVNKRIKFYTDRKDAERITFWQNISTAIQALQEREKTDKLH